MDRAPRKTSFMIYFGAVIFAAAGIGIMFLSYHVFSETRAQLADTLRTEAEVLSVTRVPNDVGEQSTAMVQFSTENGTEITAESYPFNSDYTFSPGDTVEIAYPTDGSKPVAIKGRFGYWFSSILICLFGSAFLGAGVIMPLIFKDSATGFDPGKKDEMRQRLQDMLEQEKKNTPTIKR